MSYRYGTYNQISVTDSIRSEVAKMQAQIQVTDIVLTNPTTHTYTVSCANTRKLINYMYVTISGSTNFNKAYQISNVLAGSFEIQETANHADEIGINAFWNLNIKFVFGTYKSMYQQIENLSKNERIYVIGLHERYTTQVNRPPAGIYKQPTLRLIFCTPYFDSWSEEDHELFAVKPLSNLVDLFINFANIDSYTEEVCKRYGRFSVLKGNEAHILGKVDAIEITNAKYDIEANYKCELLIN